MSQPNSSDWAHPELRLVCFVELHFPHWDVGCTPHRIGAAASRDLVNRQAVPRLSGVNFDCCMLLADCSVASPETLGEVELSFLD